MPHCGRTLLVHGQLVVTTAAELHDRFVLYNAVCDTNAIPTFDFEKYTLIGCWVTLGNCGAGHIFNITVCRDDSAHCYRHILERRENPCRGISSYMSWLLVPRLPAGYRVVFE
ncbi:MAG TPA: hypothetical protein VHI13_08405 [Candidatus Kapabacteria bacterium]|nr:hypothetical protein [Candidatus Kapabacteria bacterium]